MARDQFGGRMTLDIGLHAIIAWCFQEQIIFRSLPVHWITYIALHAFKIVALCYEILGFQECCNSNCTKVANDSIVFDQLDSATLDKHRVAFGALVNDKFCNNSLWQLSAVHEKCKKEIEMVSVSVQFVGVLQSLRRMRSKEWSNLMNFIVHTLDGLLFVVCSLLCIRLHRVHVECPYLYCIRTYRCPLNTARVFE